MSREGVWCRGQKQPAARAQAQHPTVMESDQVIRSLCVVANPLNAVSKIVLIANNGTCNDDVDVPLVVEVGLRTSQKHGYKTGQPNSQRT